MNLLAAISAEDAKDLSSFAFNKGSRLHLILPLIFFGVAVVVIFGWEYYRDWKRRKRMRRYWEAKSAQTQR
jgi:hypothetical protein